MDQRTRFVSGYCQAYYSMSELCARNGVSRKTGYKWLGRFEEHGRAGLTD